MTSSRRSSTHWAPLDRLPGESAERWCRRNAQAHRAAWQADKIARGEWLPADEYVRVTGRQGKALSPLAEAVAASKRVEAKASPKTTAPTDAPARPAEEGSALTHELGGIGVSVGIATGVELARGLARGTDAGTVARRVAVTGAQAAARSAATRAVTVGLEKAFVSATVEVAKEAGKTALKEGGKAVGKEVAKSAAKELGKSAAKEAGKTALRGNVFGAVAALVVDQGVDTARLAAGDIDRDEYARRTAENVGSAGGSLGGTAAGAAIGTAICPGIGTVIGGVLGGLLGGFGGQRAARAVVR